MDKLINLFTQRRIWVALIPAAVLIGQAAGVPLTEEFLSDFTDKIAAGVMSGLALWSYFAPKA